MPKHQRVTRNLKGLRLDPNRLSAEPGSLVEAENVVIDRKGVCEPRKGFARYGSGSALPAKPNALLEFKDTVLVHHGTTLSYDDGGSWVDYLPTITPPSGVPVRGEEARGNLYFTSDDGIYCLGSLTGAPEKAGIPAGLRVSLTTTTPASFLPDGDSVSYRVTFQRTKDDRVYQGTPSQRAIVVNSSGVTSSVLMNVALPDDIVAGDSLLIYRSAVNATGDDPGDEHFLVETIELDASDITSGIIAVTDGLEEAFIGDPLYTNPTQEGPTQTADVPPLAKDITTFRGHTLYANTVQPHQLRVQLQDPDLIADGDTLTITRGATVETFTFKTTALNPFETTLFNTGSNPLPTSAENARATAGFLALEINSQLRASMCTAELTQNPDEPPGFINLKAIDFGTDEITLDSPDVGVQNAFNEKLAGLDTTQEIGTNRIYYSKLEEPDAVPIGNNWPIGSEDYPILRILALRDSVVILKADGVFRLSGQTRFDFDIEEIDPSVRLIGAETAAVLNNGVYAATTHGISRIDENGVSLIGVLNKERYKEFIGFSNFETTAFGVSHEEDHRYVLWVPDSETDTNAKRGLSYSYLTKEWTEWTKDVSCGRAMRHDRSLYLGHASDFYVLRQRREHDETDYVDEEFTTSAWGAQDVTWNGQAATELYVSYTYTGATFSPGWLFTYLGAKSVVEEITPVVAPDTGSAGFFDVLGIGGPIRSAGAAPAAATVTTYRAILVGDTSTIPKPTGQAGWIGLPFASKYWAGGKTNFSVTLGIPIASRIKLTPETATRAGTTKQFISCDFALDDGTAQSAKVAFESEMEALEEEFDLPRLLRAIVPRDFQRCAELTISFRHTRACEKFSLAEISVTYRPVSERSGT